MAAIDPIFNGESGAAVRAKLNELIDTVNSGSTTINVGDAPLFDPNKTGGYEAGSIISYKNESSPDPEFQEFKIYLALTDIPQGVSPEDSPNWKNEGATVEVAGGNTANGVVQNITRLRELTGMRTGHTVVVQAEGAIYVFDEGSEAGIKPFAPGIGSWVKRKEISLSNLVYILDSETAGNDIGLQIPVGGVILFYHNAGGFRWLDNEGATLHSIALTEPSIISRTGAGLTLEDLTIEPIGGSAIGGHTILDPAGDTMPTQPALQFGAGFTVTDGVGKTVVSAPYIQPISFAITDKFTFKPAYALSITSADVSSNITDLRVGKNGATPATITYPYAVLATDILTFEVTFTNAYNRELNSFITLIGQYL